MTSARTTFQPITFLLVITFCSLGYFLLPTITRVPESHPMQSGRTTLPLFIAHYFRLYNKDTPLAKFDLCFLDCLSLLSVMVNLKPDAVYIHTNVPAYSYNNSCQNMSIDWSLVKVIDSPLKLKINGSQIERIEHEADIKRIESISEYGGVALDFDVYIINGMRVREILRCFECIISHEEKILNAGFLACRRPFARFPREMMEMYNTDFQPHSWIYNSGEQPMEIYKRNMTGIYLDDSIDNSPPWVKRHEMNEQYGIHDWTTKLAHHSFVHDLAYRPEDLGHSKSSFGELLRWIAEKSGYKLPEKIITSTSATSNIVTYSVNNSADPVPNTTAQPVAVVSQSTFTLLRPNSSQILASTGSDFILAYSALNSSFPELRN